MSSRKPRRSSTRRSTKRSQTQFNLGILLVLLAMVLAYNYVPQVRQAFAPLLGLAETPTAVPLPPPPTFPGTNEQPGSTPSAWQVFFTTPQYPDRAANHVGGLDTQLVALLNTAQQTIDMAIYDFDLENVAQALADAARRGVRVRLVTDTDTYTSDDEAIISTFAILKQAQIPIVDDQRGPIMHNKFVVVDGQTVLTGSWNFTVGDTYRLNNNAIRIISPQLAQNYTAEFEKMFVQKIFGPTKPKGVPFPRLSINGAAVENYFAPEDKVGEKIVARLSQAQRSIDFLAFSFTSDPIAQALLQRAEQGVQVRGVFETTGSQTQFSEYGPLKNAGLEVYTDGNPYVMHHKVFIIDGKTVIFGSYNFSDNADTANDENLLIVDDVNLAQQFSAEFERVRQVALNPLKK